MYRQLSTPIHRVFSHVPFPTSFPISMFFLLFMRIWVTLLRSPTVYVAVLLSFFFPIQLMDRQMRVQRQ